MPRRDRKRLKLSNEICVFCNVPEDNELKYGKIYRHNGITTHYYCLLLSSNMQQKGSDEEGILGFLSLDILNELRRGKRLICIYCKKNGATLSCCNAKCRKTFHLPCGLKSGSLHQYFGEFRSYCVSHRPKQNIDPRIRLQVPDQLLCYICYDNIDRNNLHETLWAPCCKKNAWFHRDCVQQLALSAGYFFKCPLCNNKKEFQKAMLDNGIFIPCQDASWELVPNAYQELLYRHDRCDAPRCKCSKGRRYTSSNPKWELILCRTCGSQGIHVACGQLKWLNTSWDCSECTSILNKSIDTSRDSRNSNDTNSVNSSANFCESGSDDSNISVGMEEPVYGPALWPAVTESPERIRIRPGPRSFKLKQQKILSELCDGSSERSNGATSRNSNPSLFGESSRGSFITDGDRFIRDAQSQSCNNDNENSNASMHSSGSHGPSPSIMIKNSSGNILCSILQTMSEDDEQKGIVTLDSDEELAEIRKLEVDPPIITENVLMTNNGLTIPVHSVEPSLPHDLRIVGDVRLPIEQTNLQPASIASAGDTASIENSNLSIGHIIVGPSNDPMIIGSFQMPALTQTTMKSVSEAPQAPSLLVLPQIVPRTPKISDFYEPSDDPLMQIKITNVTSLPPEVFANAPELTSEPYSSISNQPSYVDVESENEEIAYHLSMANQLKQSIAENNQVIRSNSASQLLRDNLKITAAEVLHVVNQSQDNSGMGEIIENNFQIECAETNPSASQSASTSFRTYKAKKKIQEHQVIPYKATASPVVKEVSGIVQTAQTCMKTYHGRKKVSEKRGSPEPSGHRPESVPVKEQPESMEQQSASVIPQPALVIPKPVQQQKSSERKEVARKRRRVDPSTIPAIHLPQGGVCLDNAAIINVMGKEYVVPLSDNPRIKVNGTWTPKYDGDAGTASAEAGVTGHHRAHGTEPTEIQQCQCKSKCSHARESDNSNTNTASTDGTDSCASSNYRHRLKENEVYLRDLKFQVADHGRVKMTVRDGLTVDLDLDILHKRRPGPKSKTRPKHFSFGSSLVRRILALNESEIVPERNDFNSVNESRMEGHSSKLVKTVERDAAKENVAPSTAEVNSGCFESSFERKIKRQRSPNCGEVSPEGKRYCGNFERNQGHSGCSIGSLKDISRSFARPKRASEPSRRALLSNLYKKKIPVRIELSRIQSLLVSKPELFTHHGAPIKRLRKSASLNDLRSHGLMENNGANSLRRSNSSHNLSSLSMLNNFDINIINDRYNCCRKEQKRKKTFEKYNCMR